jgi:hypothetical protein
LALRGRWSSILTKTFRIINYDGFSEFCNVIVETSNYLAYHVRVNVPDNSFEILYVDNDKALKEFPKSKYSKDPARIRNFARRYMQELVTRSMPSMLGMYLKGLNITFVRKVLEQVKERLDETYVWWHYIEDCRVLYITNRNRFTSAQPLGELHKTEFWYNEPYDDRVHLPEVRALVFSDPRSQHLCWFSPPIRAFGFEGVNTGIESIRTADLD